MDAARDVIAWKVAFYGQPKGWERAFIKPGFRHCSALGWLSDGLWLEIDANLARIETRVLTHDAYVERLVDLRIAGATIIEARTQTGQGLRWSPTCAGVIGGVLGLKGALRPHGLYRVLARKAAESAPP